MTVQAKGIKGSPYYGSGAHRVASGVGQIWQDAPRESIDQGSHITIAPNLSHITANPTAGASGAVNVGGYHAYLNVVDGAASDNAEIFLADGTGKLQMRTNDADNDELALCFNGGLAATGGNLPFLVAANTTIRCGLRAKVINETTVNQNDWMFGIGTPVADPITAITDGIYILKTDNDSQPDGVVEDGDTATTTDPLLEDDGSTAIAVVDDTYFECGFVINGITSVDFYFNGHKTRATDVDDLEQTNQLAPFFSIRTGTTEHVSVLIERMVFTQTTVAT